MYLHFKRSILRGGALRSDTKNGCVADYPIGGHYVSVKSKLQHPPLPGGGGNVEASI